MNKCLTDKVFCIGGGIFKLLNIDGRLLLSVGVSDRDGESPSSTVLLTCIVNLHETSLTETAAARVWRSRARAASDHTPPSA